MLASPLPLRSVGSKGTPIGTTTQHRHSTHAHTPRRDSLSSSAQLTVTVVQVSALPFRKVVESSMLPQHGLRCKFHLSVGGKALGVVGATASTAGQANTLVWQEGGGSSSMQLNVALSRDLWLGIDVLCGSLIIASTLISLDALESPPHATAFWHALQPHGRIELHISYSPCIVDSNTASHLSTAPTRVSSPTRVTTTAPIAPTLNQQLVDDPPLLVEVDAASVVNTKVSLPSSYCYNDDDANDSDERAMYPSQDSDGEPSPEKHYHHHQASLSSYDSCAFRLKQDHWTTNNTEPPMASSSSSVHPLDHLPATTVDDLEEHLVNDATIQHKMNHHSSSPRCRPDDQHSATTHMFEWTQRMALMEKKTLAATLQASKDKCRQAWHACDDVSPTSTLIRERRRSLPMPSSLSPEKSPSGCATDPQQPPHAVYHHPIAPPPITSNTSSTSSGTSALRRTRSASVRGFHDFALPRRQPVDACLGMSS
ncbi:hypothetical protein, variant [Aphanomyces astaci]|uniref:Uncharacterized protein n=1 Tax=Aphanomyces astaci TaxID=112090 RepID=W4GA68_APHAT|nr:hypothetical protein, variant [Aphanomyces astaci]ETV75969.1 hypothetical protein, variant [Aphanomyces astaci]|eukprot:XP_009834610.1 hypothetical protein, variant [Aphanomyces astaci]